MHDNSLSDVPFQADAREAVRAAVEFVNRRFPRCVAALLFGSGARSDRTTSSDLDILIIESARVIPYHQHFQESDWCFDVMGRSLGFCKKRLLSSRQSWRHRDADQILLIACAEGIELKDDRAIISGLRQRAHSILEKGPLPLTVGEISQYRRQITEALDDFVDAGNSQEAWFVAYRMVIETAQFLMGYSNRWSDEDSKWVYRRLRGSNHELARRLLDGLDRYRRTDARERLAESVESILNLAGGRLYRDDLNSNRSTTRAKQFIQHPFCFTRKAIRRVLDGVS